MTKKVVHKAIVKTIEGLDDLYIDVPGDLFNEMGWDENTKLMWIFKEDGTIVIRPPKHDTEPGIPVEFIDFLESDNKNDSSN